MKPRRQQMETPTLGVEHLLNMTLKFKANAVPRAWAGGKAGDSISPDRKRKKK